MKIYGNQYICFDFLHLILSLMGDMMDELSCTIMM
jgi:hypothetical protein